MTSELLVGIIGLAGIVIGALPTYLYMRRKNMAEIEKIKAETEKTKAETVKIQKEIQSIKSNESKDENNHKYPKEFFLSFSARREALTQTQGSILKIFSNKSYTGQYLNQDVLEKQFLKIKPSELYYRLEQLRLLGFLDNQKTGQDENGADQFSFRLSENYRKEIGNPDIFLTISSST